jgi:hypothetical protein
VPAEDAVGDCLAGVHAAVAAGDDVPDGNAGHGGAADARVPVAAPAARWTPASPAAAAVSQYLRCGAGAAAAASLLHVAAERSPALRAGSRSAAVRSYLSS